jgi:hypothetical protein
MDAKLRERTRTFPRDHAIDCTSWVDFVIVESTYRSWRIRYRELLDAPETLDVESTTRGDPPII